MSKQTEQLRTLRALTEAKLSGKISDSRKKLITLEQDKVLGKLKNVREITAIKKEIARIKTIIDEKISEKI